MTTPTFDAGRYIDTMEAIGFAVLTASDPATGEARVIVRERRTSSEPPRLSRWVKRRRGGIRNRASTYLAEAKGDGPRLVAAELRRRHSRSSGRMWLSTVLLRLSLAAMPKGSTTQTEPAGTGASRSLSSTRT